MRRATAIDTVPQPKQLALLDVSGHSEPVERNVAELPDSPARMPPAPYRVWCAIRAYGPLRLRHALPAA